MIRKIDLRSGYNIYESYKAVQRLFESDTRIKRTERIIEDNFRGILDLDGKVAGPDYYVNDNPGTVWKEYLLYNLRHTFGLMANSDVSYLPGVASIAYRDCDFDKLNQDPEKIGKLINYIRLAKKEGKLITPDMNLDELAELYEPVLKQEEDNEDELRRTLTLKHNDRYEIIRVDDFETAKYYGKFTGTGGGEGLLCYTENPIIWSNFMKNDQNYCYLCLRDDYNKIPPVQSKGYPKDDYGLSMIWVFINPDGNISNSNVRWNHGDKTFSDVDDMFTKSELEELLGVRFEDAFRPNIEVVERFKKKVEDVKRRLANGESPRAVFDEIGTPANGFTRVRLCHKYNYITINGEILSDKWFDGICNFVDGYAIVRMDTKWNYIDKTGKILSDKWFDSIYAFSEGYACVRIDIKWNFMDKNGKFLSDRWFDYAYDFSEGYANVRIGRKWNFIDKTGKFLSSRQFDYAYNFSEGYAAVRINKKWNFIDKDRKMLSKQWFDDAWPFAEGAAKVTLDGNPYYIDKEGRLRDR